MPLELRVNQPMVDLRTSAQRPVLMTNLASIFAGMAMFVNMLVTVQVLQQPTATGPGFGLGVTAAGLAMVPSGLAMVAMSPFSGWSLARWGGRVVLLVGAGLMALTYVGRVFWADSVLAVVIGSTLVGIGTALAFAAMPTLIMSSVPITETASANGLNSLVRSIGTSLASTVVAAVMATYTVEVAGGIFATTTAFQIVLVLGALAAGDLRRRWRPSSRANVVRTTNGSWRAAQGREEAGGRGPRADPDGPPGRQRSRPDPRVGARRERRTAGLEPGRQLGPVLRGAARSRAPTS